MRLFFDALASSQSGSPVGVFNLASYVLENTRVGAEVSYEHALATSDAALTRGSVFIDLVF